MSITLKDMDLVAEEGRDLCISLWLFHCLLCLAPSDPRRAPQLPKAF